MQWGLVLGLATVIAIGAGGARVRADAIRYRTPDGQLGFVQDPSAVPTGAAVLAGPASSGRVHIVPALAAAGGSQAALAAGDSTDPEEAESPAEATRKSIRQAQRELAEAVESRKKTCGNGYYGSRKPHFPGRLDCYEDTRKKQAAEARLEEIRRRLDEDLEDLDEYFAPDDDSDTPPAADVDVEGVEAQLPDGDSLSEDADSEGPDLEEWESESPGGDPASEDSDDASLFEDDPDEDTSDLDGWDSEPPDGALEDEEAP